LRESVIIESKGITDSGEKSGKNSLNAGGSVSPFSPPLRHCHYPESYSDSCLTDGRCKGMKCILIGGFSGSGKTTLIRELVEHLEKQEQKVGVIANEIGAKGTDGDTILAGEVKTGEITSGCVYCPLKISMEYTLRNLIASYNPDTIIIEPTGMASPGQIKRNIENMGIPGITFAPILDLVDAGRLSQEPSELQNFMKNQISEAEILGINKVELINNREELLEICLSLRKLNSRARMIHFSARQGGENLDKLLGLLEETSRRGMNLGRENSIQMSEVSAYSS
jgi:G3E family GTPase